ncbi:MAG: stage VI sporulation protein F [Erysipelotrichaceae bacterium]|nr:stage VI sporulation protein F [Erysipelotrichaceae bacterium]
MSRDDKDSIFEKVESKTNVKKDDIVKLAKSVSSKDLSDERNIRKLIKEVAKLAGKDVSKEKEEKIINAIKKDKIPKDLKNVM